MGGSAWWAVSPVWTYGNPGAGLHENPAMTGFRTLFFATVAVGPAELTATRVGGKTPGTGRRADAAFLAVPLLLAGVGLARPPTASLRDPDPPRVCEQVAGTRVCVHQAHSPLLPGVTTLTRQALTLVGDDYAARFREAVDQALVPRAAPDQIGLNLYLDSREDLRQQLALDLASGLARQPACSLDTEFATEEQSMTEGVAFWIYSHIADPSADRGFFIAEGIEGDASPAVARRPRRPARHLHPHPPRPPMTVGNWRTYLRGRRSRPWLAMWATSLLALLAASPFAVTVPVKFLDGKLTRWTPLWELLPCLLGALSGALLNPRLASWELTGTRRIRHGAAATAVAALTLLTYGGAITIQHANPALGRRIPFSGIIGNVEPHFAVAGTLSLLAVAAWTTTRGESRLAYRLRRND